MHHQLHCLPFLLITIVHGASLGSRDTQGRIVNGNTLTDLKFDGEPNLAVKLQASSGNVGDYSSYFPDCTADPSYSKGTSQYKDGTGVYVKSSCDNGHDTIFDNYWHCWTDLYVVDQQAGYTEWHNTGSVIDCKSTSQCAEWNIDLGQTCTTDTTTWDNTFGAELEIEIPLWFKDGKATTILQYDHSFGGQKAVQICTSQSSTAQCTWNDGGCHAIWSAKRNIQFNGYLRRSCNSPRDGTNIPIDKQQDSRDDGYYTVGMQDFSFQVPNNRIVGCAAKCGDLSYPDPVPGDDPKTPVTPP